MTHLIRLLFAVQLWWVVDCQFSCTVGVDCKLPLYDYDMPATPSVRVGEAQCGTVSMSSMLEFTGAPEMNFPIGVMPSIVGHASTLFVCLAASSGPDPTYSIPFGTLDVIGPTVGRVYPCYFGSTCDITVTGNKLTEVTSLLFVTDSGDCSIVPPPTTLYGLLSPRAVLASASTSFPYISFGRVDPALTVQQSLNLCWSAIDVQGRSVPVSIGSVSLEGPPDRITNILCYMGSPCELTYPNLTIGNSYFRTSDSDTNECGFTNSAISVWPGIAAISTAINSSSYSFGIPMAVNDLVVNETALCWSSNLLGPYLVKVGGLTMVGPTRADNRFECVRGMFCDIIVPGAFPSTASLVGNISLREGSCVGPLVVLDDSGIQQSSVAVSYLGEFAKATFSQISLAPTNIAVCWEVEGGTTSILAGSLDIQGPTDLASTFTCELSLPCQLDLSVTGLEGVNQTVLLVASPAGSHTDPCLTYDPSELYFESWSSEFVFSSINRVVDSVLVRSVCWMVDGGSRAVPIGEFFVNGPLANQPVYTCTLASANPCEVTIPFSNSPNEESVLFLTNTGACVGSNYRTQLPLLRGGAAVGSVTTFSSASKSWSFGSIVGWTDVEDNSLRVFELCYGITRFRRRPSVVASLVIDRPIHVLSGIVCTTGEVCDITLTSATALPGGYQIFLSTHVACNSAATQNVFAHSGKMFRFDALAGGFEGIGIHVCGVSDGLSLGTITVEGMALGSAGCVLGSPQHCIIEVSSRGAWVDADILVASDCATPIPILGFNGSSAVSWSIADTAHIVSSTGLSRVPNLSSSELALCLNGMSVGSVGIIGPIETSSYTCLNGASCQLAIAGYFPSGYGGSQVALIPFTNTLTNPCTNVEFSAATSNITRSVISEISVDFKPFEIEAGEYIVCWRYSGSYESVPAGTLTVVGAKFSSDLSCIVSSSQLCELTVAVEGVAQVLTDAKVGLSVIPDCSDEISLWERIEDTSTNQMLVYKVGPVSAITPDVTLCWSSSAEPDTPIPIGTIALSRTPCDERIFYPTLLEESELISLVSSADLACEVSITVGGLEENFSLVRFAFGHTADAIDTELLAETILRLRTSELRPLVNEGNETVLMTAITREAPTQLIIDLITSVEIKVNAATAQLSVHFERDDVCALIVSKLDEDEIEPLLPLAVTANMPECISAISDRRLTVGAAALGLAAAVNSTNVAAFHAIAPMCESMSQCLEVNVVGATSLGDILRERNVQGLDTVDPFWMLARDHLLLDS